MATNDRYVGENPLVPLVRQSLLRDMLDIKASLTGGIRYEVHSHYAHVLNPPLTGGEPNLWQGPPAAVGEEASFSPYVYDPRRAPSGGTISPQERMEALPPQNPKGGRPRSAYVGHAGDDASLPPPYESESYRRVRAMLDADVLALPVKRFTDKRGRIRTVPVKPRKTPPPERG